MHVLFNYHGVRFYIEQTDLVADITFLIIACSAIITATKLYSLYSKPPLLRNISIGLLVLVVALILKIDDDLFILPWVVRYVLMNVIIVIGSICIGLSFIALVRKLYKSNSTDDLTGCFNRGYFECVINEQTKHDQMYSVLYLDVDNFKIVNDRLGHNIGDTLLKEIAQTLRNTVRASDIVARLGGDEFAVFLPRSGEMQAKDTAKRIATAIANRFKSFHGMSTNASIGIATFPIDARNCFDLVKIADERMYEIKTKKKNGEEIKPIR